MGVGGLIRCSHSPWRLHPVAARNRRSDCETPVKPLSRVAGQSFEFSCGKPLKIMVSPAGFEPATY